MPDLPPAAPTFPALVARAVPHSLPVWQPFGEGAVLLRWPQLSPELSRRVVTQLSRVLETRRPPEVLEWIPGLDSLALLYDPRTTDRATLERRVTGLLEAPAPGDGLGLTHRIPVCYHPSLAPDLLEVAERCGLSPEALVAQHTACTFEVALLGFAPGFAYLEGLGWPLSVPRLASPRVRVPAGSVALGGAHCGIYPLESAGGWQLIGRTPLRLFDPALEPPGRLGLGDWVSFEVISLEAFQRAEFG